MMNVSVVIPSYKEKENLKYLIPNVLLSLNDSLREIIVVDDNSKDGTEMLSFPKTKILIRQDKGLASAILTGIEESKTDRVIVMDADGQHNPFYLPSLLTALDHTNLVVASRNIKGGGVLVWSLKRRILSKIANLLAYPLTGVKDSSSGFFGLNKTEIDLSNVKVDGFKLVLEMCSRYEAQEIPYYFGIRYSGTSKMSLTQSWHFLKQLARLYWKKFDLTRMTKFCIVGTFGLGVNSVILFSLTDFGGLYYLASNVIAVMCAMLFNFTFNRNWTFK